MMLERLPPIQQLILRRALENGGKVRLADLSLEARKIVRYRASAALHQNSILLERKGIVERYHDGRAVVVRIKPKWIQPLRKSLGISADICYMGLAFGEDALKKIRASMDLVTFSPKRIVLISEEPSRESLRGELDDLVHEWVLVDPSDYHVCRLRIEDKVSSLLPQYEVVCDLSGGNRIMALALSEVGRGYGLRRFLVTENKTIVWIY